MTIHYFALSPEAQWTMAAVLAAIPFLTKRLTRRLFDE